MIYLNFLLKFFINLYGLLYIYVEKKISSNYYTIIKLFNIHNAK